LVVKVVVRIPCADSALILDQLELPIKPEPSLVMGSLTTGACLTGGRPITRLPVCPVPNPKITRPGASWLIVAIECTVTGDPIRRDRHSGSKLDRFRIHRRQRHVRAYASPQIMCESGIHA
jgi:hypothetical protein